MNKKLFKVKFKYFTFQLENNFKKPACIAREYGEFFFNWSIETAKQFAKHLLSIQPTKFFISSTSEIEAISNKKEVFQKILDNYNKIDNKKIDKYEFLCLIPFIVDNNFENAITVSLSFFCIENEGQGIITKLELELYFDCYFRSLHNMILVEDIDEIYEKTQKNILKLNEAELDEFVNLVFNQEEEMHIKEVVK